MKLQPFLQHNSSHNIQVKTVIKHIQKNCTFSYFGRITHLNNNLFSSSLKVRLYVSDSVINFLPVGFVRYHGFLVPREVNGPINEIEHHEQSWKPDSTNFVNMTHTVELSRDVI